MQKLLYYSFKLYRCELIQNKIGKKDTAVNLVGLSYIQNLRIFGT